MIIAQREPNSARRYALDARIAASIGDLRGAMAAIHRAAEIDPSYQSQQ